MKRVAEASERGFLDCFALRGVGMDNSGYIFQPRAHFYGGRKACG